MKRIFSKSLLHRIRANMKTSWWRMEQMERKHREAPWLASSYRQMEGR